VTPTATRSTGADARVDVRKTYKLYIGGKFPRSESGRSYEVVDGRGKFLANAAQGSRKDARDAVQAARKAQPGWAKATAYNRGQVLYRVAEMVEARASEFAELCSGRDEVERSIAASTSVRPAQTRARSSARASSISARR
jgi:acyl-CoA reductase-like NAD-dependent aldehyde dehydrogenase